MPPPSSGGIAVAATLGILEHFDMAQYRPTDIDLNGGRPTVMGASHLGSRAAGLRGPGSLRRRYRLHRVAWRVTADPAGKRIPGRPRCADFTGPHHGHRQAGDFGPSTSPVPQPPEHGTSHISVVDKHGNAASLTTTIEAAFGSFHMVDGFLLNNELTDFSAEPAGADGVPVANRLQPGKRPRSSMSPTLIFDRTPSGQRGALYVAGRPVTGRRLIHRCQDPVGFLDWGLDPQLRRCRRSASAPPTPKTNVGGEHPEHRHG